MSETIAMTQIADIEARVKAGYRGKMQEKIDETSRIVTVEWESAQEQMLADILTLLDKVKKLEEFDAIKAAELALDDPVPLEEDISTYRQIIRTLLDMVRWIPVSERLPESATLPSDGALYLLKLRDYAEPMPAYRVDTNPITKTEHDTWWLPRNSFRGRTIVGDDEVTHYMRMPLPAPPEEDNDK